MMGRRRTYRRPRSHRIARGVVIALVLLVAAPALLRLAGLLITLTAHPAGCLVLLAATGTGAYRLGLHRRPVARAQITTADPGTAMLKQQAAQLQHDLDQSRAEIGDLRGQLADAQASATAAWDQASSRPPRRALGDTAPLDVLDAEQLAAQPMSGARRLGGA